MAFNKNRNDKSGFAVCVYQVIKIKPSNKFTEIYFLGVQTFHHLTFIHPADNHGHLITLKFNYRDTLSRFQVSQEKSRKYTNRST